MNDRKNIEDVAEAIWTAWVDWARHEPNIDESLLEGWDELSVDRKDAGYRMAEAALIVVRDEAALIVVRDKDKTRPRPRAK